MAQLFLGISTVFFFVAFFFFGRDLLYATKVLFICTVISTVICAFLWKKVKLKDWALLIATLGFAGLTLYFHNADFIKWRPTVINLVGALILLGLYFFKTAPFEYLFAKALELKLPQKEWLRVNLIWAVYLLISAALNTFFVLTQPDDIWVIFKTFVMPGLSIVFMIGLFAYLFMQNKKYSLKSNEKP